MYRGIPGSIIANIADEFPKDLRPRFVEEEIKRNKIAAYCHFPFDKIFPVFWLPGIGDSTTAIAHKAHLENRWIYFI